MLCSTRQPSGVRRQVGLCSVLRRNLTGPHLIQPRALDQGGSAPADRSFFRFRVESPTPDVPCRWPGRVFTLACRLPSWDSQFGPVRFLSSGVLDSSNDEKKAERGIDSPQDEFSESNATISSQASHPALPRFRDLELHPRLREALAAQRLHDSGVNLDTQMTDVQNQVWTAAASGPTSAVRLSPPPTGNVVDVIARARTGTGKTLAYLLPALNRLFREQDQRGANSARRNGVRMVVLSPTRELARQIYNVAVGLTASRAPGTDVASSSIRQSTLQSDAFSECAQSDDIARLPSLDDSALHCQVLHGGVPKRVDIDAFHRVMPHVLVATPGRLLDHITSTYVETNGLGDGQHDRKPFSSFLQSVTVLVIDEVDRLLDMGFLDDISIILNQLPVNRQTYLLSATLPTSVREVMLQHVHPTDHVILDCVGTDVKGGWDDEHAAATTVKQSYAVIPMNRMISGVVEAILYLLQNRRSSPKRRAGTRNKLLVFFPTTSQVMFFSCLLNQHLGRHAWELHSGMSQSQRQMASDAFRHATSGVLLTSDVSARGVDYPGISHVIQVGMARNRETYLHRLGRTGRAGRRGKGILLLLEPELEWLKQDLSGLAVGRNASIQKLLDQPPSTRMKSDLLQVAHELRHGNANALSEHAENCYRSILLYYYSRLGYKDASRLDVAVDIANAFSYETGLPELPTVPVRVAMQYGMLNHQKLNIDQKWTIGTRFDVGRSTTDKHAEDDGNTGDLFLNPEASELWINEENLDWRDPAHNNRRQ